MIELSPHGVMLYLDPSSGGYLLQILFAGVAGIAVFVKLLWYRLRSLFRRRRSTHAPEPGSAPGPTEVESDRQ